MSAPSPSTASRHRLQARPDQRRLQPRPAGVLDRDAPNPALGQQAPHVREARAEPAGDEHLGRRRLHAAPAGSEAASASRSSGSPRGRDSPSRASAVVRSARPSARPQAGRNAPSSAGSAGRRSNLGARETGARAGRAGPRRAAAGGRVRAPGDAARGRAVPLRDDAARRRRHSRRERSSAAAREQVALCGQLRVGLDDHASRDAELGGQCPRRRQPCSRREPADRGAQRVFAAGSQRAAGRGVQIEVEVHLAPDYDGKLALEDRAKWAVACTSMKASPPSQRARVRRVPRPRRLRARDDRRDPRRGAVAHLGFAIDDQPYVIPTLHARVGDIVYVHGSSASRAIRAPHRRPAGLPDGHAARRARARALGLPSLDELPLGRGARRGARRSKGRDERLRALEAFTERLVPGRWDEVRPPTPQELKGTRVLALDARRGVGEGAHRPAGRRRRGLRARRLGRRRPARRPGRQRSRPIRSSRRASSPPRRCRRWARRALADGSAAAGDDAGGRLLQQQVELLALGVRERGERLVLDGGERELGLGEPLVARRR